MSEKLNDRTAAKIGNWLGAQKAYFDAKREMRGCETAMRNAANALGKHLAPADAVVSEEFAIWVERDGERQLLYVRCVRQGEFQLEWRDTVKGRNARASGS